MFKVVRDSGVTYVEYVETACPRKACDRPYRIDEHNPSYAEIKAALERGDRSVLRCYHDR